MRGIYNMKKKAVCLCLTAAVLLGLVGCGNEKEPPVTIAVVTDGENVDDLAVNQAIWQAVQAYGEKSGERTGYYVPEDEGGAALEQAMDEAVEKGAEVIICHGEAAETAVYEAQREYRDVRFLMFDGEPHAEGSERARLRGNTRCILFNKEEAGFLAGYAAVKEGYTSLAYYGGADQERAQEYGAGFLQGAQNAASEMKLEKGAVRIQYEERGTDEVSPEFMTEVQQKYQDGCQAVFTDGGGFEPIVRRSAEITGGKVIGVVTDESLKSTTVVISAENKYEEILTEELEKIRSEEFKGGKTTVLGIQEDAIALTTDTSQMQNFNEEQNQQITEQFKTNKITLQGTKLLKDTGNLKQLEIE